MLIEGFGISVDLPEGWEGRIFMDPDSQEEVGFKPVMHCANFQLVADNSNFAQGIIQTMGGGDSLLALVEYDASLVKSALFTSGHWPPILAAADLKPNAFPGTRPDGLGANQNFTNVSGRAFCAYCVVGSQGDGTFDVEELNVVVGSIAVLPEPGI